MATARGDKDGWIRCQKCGHKLGRIAGAWDEHKRAFPAIEIKCHSCKDIVYILVGSQKAAESNPRH